MQCFVAVTNTEIFFGFGPMLDKLMILTRYQSSAMIPFSSRFVRQGLWTRCMPQLITTILKSCRSMQQALQGSVNLCDGSWAKPCWETFLCWVWLPKPKVAGVVRAAANLRGWREACWHVDIMTSCWHVILTELSTFLTSTHCGRLVRGSFVRQVPLVRLLAEVQKSPRWVQFWDFGWTGRPPGG